MGVKVIFHGQSNIEIHSGSHHIQIDPFYDQNPITDVKAKDVNPEFIFLTHAHGDHVADAEAIARRTGATIVAAYEVAAYFGKKGLKVVGMNHGGGMDFPFGRAFMTIAFHTSSFDDGAYGGQPAGWIFQTGGKTIYHAGDTALFGDMELIGKLFPIDLACLPIGDCYTMGPAHAILAAKMLKTKMVLPMHYNTFPQIAQDGPAFGHTLEKETGARVRAVVLKPGGSAEM
ncbi:MAG: metal-dependent hydrolase [Tepidisphaeraceae bacterium]